MLPPIMSNLRNIIAGTRVSTTQLFEEVLQGKEAMSLWEGNVQQLMNSHYTMYTLRQSLYTWILNQSELFKEMISTSQSTNLTHAFYFGVLVVTVVMFVGDLKYKKKSVKRVLQIGVSNKNAKRVIETTLLFVMMVLFQNVDVATG